ARGRRPLDPGRWHRPTHPTRGRGCTGAGPAHEYGPVAGRVRPDDEDGVLVSAPTPPALDADLTAGLRRLKLATMRQLAPELLINAKTQRWSPEEVLRALVEAEIAARDASNERARIKAATFPVVKTIEDFDLAASSIPA